MIMVSSAVAVLPREQAFVQAMADRQDWEHATASSRHLAVAADAELRCRHPGQKIEPLRSTEPVPVPVTERDGKLPETDAWNRDLAHAASCIPRETRPAPASDDGRR